MRLDMGSVPDWLAGGGAVLALFLAAWAAHSAYKTNRNQSDQLRELQNEARQRADQELRSQAKHVSAWLSESLTLAYSNMSSEPVYAVEISFSKDGFKTKANRGVIAPNVDGQVHKEMSRTIHTLLSHAAATQLGIDPKTYQWGHVTDDTTRINQLIGTLKPEWVAHGVSIRFRDAAGNRWLRDRHGTLQMEEIAPT